MTPIKAAILAPLFLAAALALPSRGQQPAADSADSVGSIIRQTDTEPDGKKISNITLTGTLGEVSFTLDEKEAAKIGDGMNLDMAALTKMYVEKSQQKLGATPEEWKLLGPKISLIQRLKGVLRSHGQYASSAGAAADFQKAWKTLSTLLKDKDAKSDDIKTALQAVNDAQAAVTRELRQAQADLMQLLTVKQEALLVKNLILE